MFYTYLWLRQDGTPKYVGKGSGNRAYEQRGHRIHLPPKERIIVQEFEGEEDAFFAEKFLITIYGRLDNNSGCLANLTDGGEGPAGLIMNQETRYAMSRAAMGKIRSEAYRKNISKGKMGHPVAEKVRERLRETSKGNGNAKGTRSEAARRNISEGHKGLIPWNKGLRKKIYGR